MRIMKKKKKEESDGERGGKKKERERTETRKREQKTQQRQASLLNWALWLVPARFWLLCQSSEGVWACLLNLMPAFSHSLSNRLLNTPTTNVLPTAPQNVWGGWRSGSSAVPPLSAPQSQIAIAAILYRKGQIAEKFCGKSAIFAQNSQNQNAIASDGNSHL